MRMQVVNPPRLVHSMYHQRVDNNVTGDRNPHVKVSITQLFGFVLSKYGHLLEQYHCDWATDVLILNEMAEQDFANGFYWVIRDYGTHIERANARRYVSLPEPERQHFNNGVRLVLFVKLEYKNDYSSNLNIYVVEEYVA